MRLPPDEFIRRFPLPDGFHRIRHYGLLARADRERRLALCRRLAAADHPVEPKVRACDAPSTAAAQVFPCPDCGGLIRRIGAVPPAKARPFHCDTS